MLDAEDSIVAALSGVEQVQHRVPRVAVDLVSVKSLEDGRKIRDVDVPKSKGML